MPSRSRRPAAAAALLLAALLLALSACGGGATSSPARPATTGSSGAAAGAAAAAPAAPAAAAPPLRTVRLAYVSTATIFSGLWAAKDYGLFEQHGLRVDELMYINGGPLLVQALVAGELDGGYLALSPSLTAIVSGAPLKVVAGVGHGFLHHLFVRDGGGIVQPADMRGKRAGVSRVGAESHTVVRFWARSHGLADDDILYVAVGGAGERFAALTSGSVDLLPLDPPSVPKAEKAGYRRLADLTREALPWQQDGLAFREQTLRDEPALARAITAAVIEGAYLLRADRQRALEVLGKYIQEDDTEGLDLAYQAYARKLNQRARPEPANVQAVQDFVEETLPGAAREPYARFVDTRLLDELEREGFFTRLERQYPAP
jgi:ABC-type nitrate/sulfonate/bicarbonate transport system substrate-binding protein